MRRLSIFLASLIILSPIALTFAQSQGIQQLQQWATSGANIKLASTTASIRVPFLVNCDTIDTDSSGVFKCGTDQTGAGGGSWPFAVGTYAGQTAQSTSTSVLWLKASPISLAASSSVLTYASTTEISALAGTVSNPSFFVEGAGGLYKRNTNEIGLTNGVSSVGWNGTSLVPGTTDARDFGSVGNRWSNIYGSFIRITDAGGIATTTLFNDTTDHLVIKNSTTTGNLTQVTIAPPDTLPYESDLMLQISPKAGGTRTWEFDNQDTNQNQLNWTQSARSGAALIPIVMQNCDYASGSCAANHIFMGMPNGSVGLAFGANGTSSINQNAAVHIASSTATWPLLVDGAVGTHVFSVTPAGISSTTGLVVSNLGGTGTRCLQVGADGTVSANASACGSGTGTADDPFTHPVAGASATTSAFLITNASTTINGNATTTGTMFMTMASSTYASSTMLTSGGGNFYVTSAGSITKLNSTAVSMTGSFLQMSNPGGEVWLQNNNSQVNSSLALKAGSAANDVASYVQIEAGGSARARITGNGATGFGTTTPFGYFSINTPYNWATSTLFVIASSTNTATTTFLSLSNLGVLTTLYGSSTAQTISGTASTTALVVSNLGGTGTRCLQVGADGTVSANASACGTGAGTSAFEMASTSDIAQGQVAYINKTTGRTTLASVATGTVSSSGGITTTASRYVLGGALAISCDVATASVPGCLAAADFTTFTGKLGSYDAWVHPTEFATTTSATSTPIWAKMGLYASSTSQFSNATTAQATIGTTWLTGPTTNQMLALDVNGKVYSAATSTLSTISGSLDLASQVGSSRLPFANLAQVSANSVLANNTSATADARSVATSTLYGVCTGGQVVGWSNTISGLTCMATSSSAGGTPAGNSGNIQFNNGGSFGGNDGLFYDFANNRAGIGTSSPFAMFSIQATSSANYTASRTIFAIASSTAAFATTTLFSVDNAGHTAIAASSSGALLNIQNDASNNFLRLFSSTGSTTMFIDSSGNFTWPADNVPTVHKFTGANQNNTNVAGSAVQFLSGRGNGTGAGGDFSFSAGQGGASGIGGGFTLTAGSGGSAGNGGAFSVFGGAGGTGGAAQNGGAVSLTGGNSAANGTAGTVTISGGTQNSTSDGASSGNVAILGGSITDAGGACTTCVAGAISLTAGSGAAASATAGGNITLTGGAGGAGDVSNGGSIILKQGNLANGGKYGDIAFYNGAGSLLGLFASTTNKFGIGATTSPWALFSINPNGVTGPVFTIGSSTGSTTLIVDNAGKVGIATTSPWGLLSINADDTVGVIGTRPLFTIGSSTGKTYFQITNGGHEVTSGTKPVLSSCGTNPAVIQGNDHAGVLRIGTGATTACTMTFANTYSTASNSNVVACDFSAATSTIAIAASTTPTTVTLAYTSSNNIVMNYICVGAI